jgi:hypothetical protein
MGKAGCGWPMSTIGLIPRQRLANIPPHLRIAHEYCYFLHDECVRILSEYEAAEAHVVSVKTTPDLLKELDALDPISALRKAGYPAEARKVIVNNITMALISDMLHHLFEALSCLEHRKVVVAFNLLRKPLKDNLPYLSWMLAEPDDFYAAFASGTPEKITQKQLGNKRLQVFQQALATTDAAQVLDAAKLHDVLFSKTAPNGFEKLFQHAVHLVTVERIELKTSPENFNFIFKSLAGDDLYELTYSELPAVLLYMAHVVFGLFEAMRKDPKAREVWSTRTILGFRLVHGLAVDEVTSMLNDAFHEQVKCAHCRDPLLVTEYNAFRICLTETFRCTSCRRNNSFPFSWML